MKRFFLPLLLCLFLPLTACGKAKGEEAFAHFAERLNACEQLRLTANVRAEYEHKTARFTLLYEENAEGGRVTVMAPELIRGVKAHMNADGTKLIYDSVAVDTGDDGGTGLSPMGALPQLGRALRNGSVEAVWKEDGALGVQLVPEDDVGVTVLFDAEMKPSHAEIDHEGVTVLFIDIAEFS